MKIIFQKFVFYVKGCSLRRKWKNFANQKFILSFISFFFLFHIFFIYKYKIILKIKRLNKSRNDKLKIENWKKIWAFEKRKDMQKAILVLHSSPTLQTKLTSWIQFRQIRFRYRSLNVSFKPLVSCAH